MAAYILFLRRQTTDTSQMRIYGEKAALARDGHDVVPLVRYGALEVLEGEAVEGVAILRFEDEAAARAWYADERYQDAVAHRRRGADYQVIFTQGV